MNETSTTATSPRTLVLCFDGPGNRLDDNVTNVVRLFDALEKRKREQQMCYYQPGIGTYVSPTVPWAQISRRVSKLADLGFAWYLSGHIMGGYRFLMSAYREGDKICLFGFSSGAYTARCLAGMLHKVGLLPKGNEEQIQFAWELYKDYSLKGAERAKMFKRTFSATIDIEFVGVWDTLASVCNRHYAFTSSGRVVKTFRQALSLDERRTMFKPNPWHHPVPVSPVRDGRNLDPGVSRHNQEENHTSTITQNVPIGERKRRGSRDSEDSQVYDRGGGFVETDVKEVWFAGCHADVGGGSVQNDTIHSLANPSLSWMINEIIRSRCGVIFRRDALKDIPGVDAALGINQAEAVPEDLILDAKAQTHDQLTHSKLWWILEWTPRWEYKQDENNRWHKRLCFNRGRGREIQLPDPLFHYSVSMRQDYMEGGYTPRAKFKGEPRFVDWPADSLRAR